MNKYLTVDADSFYPMEVEDASASRKKGDITVKTPKYLDMLIEMANEYLPKAGIPLDAQNLVRFIQGGELSVQKRFNVRLYPRYRKSPPEYRPQINDMTLTSSSAERSLDE